MATFTQRLGRTWEIRHPSFLAAAAFAITVWQGQEFYDYATANEWRLDQLYIAVFTISTVITAFLFTFYTFIMTGDRGFLPEARNTTYFRQTITYTFRAITVGSALALSSIPMLVVEPALKDGGVWLFVAAVWVALAVWAGAAFVRAAWLFRIFAGRRN